MGLQYDPEISAALMGMRPVRHPDMSAVEHRCAVALEVQRAVAADSQHHSRIARRAAHALIDLHEYREALASVIDGGGASPQTHVEVAAILMVTPAVLALWLESCQPSDVASRSSAARAIV